MPPRIRTRVTKVLKENIDIEKKAKSDVKVSKQPRKPLADKTNSLSDDNASIDIPVKIKKTELTSFASKANSNTYHNGRSRRERRLPPRYVENQILKNLSNNREPLLNQRPITSEAVLEKKASQNKPVSTQGSPNDISTLNTDTLAKTVSVKDSRKVPSTCKISASKSGKSSTKLFPGNNILPKDEGIPVTARPRRNCRLQSAAEKPVSKDSNVSTPVKTPSSHLESSFVANRPKRICRLPSKFDDHSISPSKFIPIHPSHASTPIISKHTKSKDSQHDNLEKLSSKTSDEDNYEFKSISKRTKKQRPTKVDVRISFSNSSADISSPDTNNNGKKRTIRAKRNNQQTKLCTKQISPKSNKFTPFAKRLLDKSISFRVLDSNKNTKDKGLDIYEFTFDPDEEPPPQKKKRKRAVKKKPAKAKTIIMKSNYNDNVSKALLSLKTKIKSSQPQPVRTNIKPMLNDVQPTTVDPVQSIQPIPVTKDIPKRNNYAVDIPAMPTVDMTTAVPPVDESVRSIHESNYASICVEDIAADFELDHHDDINYSPINSPQHPETPKDVQSNKSQTSPVINNDPLNLQEDLSFFNEHPVASSSMNVSVRHPLASPWRVEFGNLPVKWHSDTYVKSNMTPAVGSSFICSDESKKKHVYTNIFSENEPVPEVGDNIVTNLKQPSIISFMKEVAERSANKKKRQISRMSTKVNSICDDVNTFNDFGYKLPKKAKISKDTINSHSSDRSHEKENSNQSDNVLKSPCKVQKKIDKDCTYFGFDDTEDSNQENVSPVKIVPKTQKRGLRPRPVLQDFNAQITQAGPTRAALPVASKVKLTSSEVADKLYDQLKSTEDAQFPEKEIAKEPANDTVITNVDDPSWHEEEDDSQSVHLFEDIEVVHHLKHHRKSYGKSKKVTFQQQQSNSDSDSQPLTAAAPAYSSDDDLADLTFQMPHVKQKKVVKKKKPKKQLSKKEEKEVEEWAAGFNSMCEDIDEFALVVE